MNAGMTEAALLQFAMENGMLDVAQVQAQYVMKKRIEILERHKYKVWQGKDKKWRTYLPKQDGERQLVKRSTRESIEDVIIAFYEEGNLKKDVVTFETAYLRWRSVQDELVSPNTVAKYKSDYRRYFEGQEFVQKEIKKITVEDIKLFVCRTIKGQGLCKEACKMLFGYISRTFESAVINKNIQKNPMDGLKVKDFYKYCQQSKKDAQSRLISEEDMFKLYQQFREDYKNIPSYIPTYAVEFASLTGMRVGEIAALTWDCIQDSGILVKQSEKYDRQKKVYYIDATKNEKERLFPLTKEIRELLEQVKRVEERNGFLCEWVFANENGRINAPTISSCSKNKCRQLGIPEKGIHAYRRTLNSKIRYSGVSATVAASLMGHSEAVNNEYYTYDVTGLEEKMRIVESINQTMPFAGDRDKELTR